MLISRELAKAFNKQIGYEFGASMQYVSIAAHFNRHQLTLLAKLFFAQAEEERQHALKFVQYLLDTKGDLKLPAVPAPTPAFRHAQIPTESGSINAPASSESFSGSANANSSWIAT